MPWNPERDPSDGRADFVEAVLLRHAPFAQTCRHFEISRKTGYKWLESATSARPQPLRDRSCRPHHCPSRTPEAVERLLPRERAGVVVAHCPSRTPEAVERAVLQACDDY